MQQFDPCIQLAHVGCSQYLQLRISSFPPQDWQGLAGSGTSSSRNMFESMRDAVTKEHGVRFIKRLPVFLAHSTYSPHTLTCEAENHASGVHILELRTDDTPGFFDGLLMFLRITQ